MAVIRKKLTIKKHNRQYNNRERELGDFLFKLLGEHPEGITVSLLTEAAGINRTGFYRYFRSISALFKSSIRCLLRGYQKILDGHKADDAMDANRYLLIVTFVFMVRRKEAFCPICSNTSEQYIVYMMMRKLYPYLKLTWLPVDGSKLDIDSNRVDSYLRLLAGIFCQWGKETGCDLVKITPYLNRTISVTKALTQRKIY